MASRAPPALAARYAHSSVGARACTNRPYLLQRNSLASAWKRAVLRLAHWPASARALPRKGVAFSFFKIGSPAPKLPEVVKAGDPVLNEPADPVPLSEICTPRIQEIIDNMIAVMRAVPGVGLAAPQTGIPLQIIVLEDTKEYISYVSEEEANLQQRIPFDLLVICNPILKPLGTCRARFFEGCMSIEGYRGLVERQLEVEVSGFGRDGSPIKLQASGWQARILQHECDHLKGELYVDKMLPKSFRTSANLRLPLASGCPKPGLC
ncbi:hypothetical protein KP509_36G060200 [Ceratopteris richardii]|uniref:Peptide deformylase n=1 Tax=Ceratopteris richardii TaxID=49495 RepID=A0A8T2QDL3_CERRI|nr:hypothetical protein KP509_36G060200 [Ceratopteris richardii]